ncbi:glucose-1-phosphate adenylyltransferase [Aneurinibacillus sp. Ricciae_BoGa-3]|uniref:glucose-1-phosphate adenylyltransferase n=1 Tax=Aneurinibacillus sp. Ricciae_BoGa-3 TaxID=3022697 RepID=UPI0023418874|nr:glucose-1-phosphate adenylyltransferase [Aneurinibacillus sp. Ricciae_BoGa-3]WCK52697.1 glucose-1-phosphate adenylyltransferase [Aneurinibacillus sp. Ricciae_BoGa-3]
MKKKECVAMLLAGGEGRRLGVLTAKMAKPAVPFGGKYRIIDFTLSNCTNSGIDTVGVLTQYQPFVLNSYIGIGSAWDLDRNNGGVSVLPPFIEQEGGRWYRGTANAIFQNIAFIERYDPKYVLIISGDHIYTMNYNRMLKFHKEKKAEATIAVIEVPWEETSRFGIMSTGENDKITEFTEKPSEAQSNLASMGIYIFNWDTLKKYLQKDEENPESNNDFGKDIIPSMLAEERKMFAYPFEGYWKDVGTIDSLWQANMDLLNNEPSLDLNDNEWRIYSVNPNQPPQYIAPGATITQSLINEGCSVFGHVDHSVLFYGVDIGQGSYIKDSVIMPNAKIGANVVIERAIIGEGTVVEDGVHIGNSSENSGIALIGENQVIRNQPQYENRAASSK